MERRHARAFERAKSEVGRHHEDEVELQRASEQCLQQEHQRAFAALQRKALDEAVACERAEELQQMAHRGRGWPQLRQAATAPTEGELQTSCSAATAPTKGKPTVGDDEALTRDGPRSSRHASEAAGGMMMRPADLEAARQQREEALTAFSETTPVVAARP